MFVNVVRYPMIACALVALCALAVGCADESPSGEPADGEARESKAVTPADFPRAFLPGIESPGVIPAREYLIAFSNGDMDDLWRICLLRDFEEIGRKYLEAFGVSVVVSTSGNDSGRQIEDIRQLLKLEPDLLIFSANESAPLAVVHEMCQKARVPYITVDRGVSNPSAWDSPDDMYVSHISVDFMKQGVIQGHCIAEYLKKKNGRPVGNVIELAGMPLSQPGKQRSQGLHLVLDSYPEIRVVESVSGRFDRDKGYDVMRKLLSKYEAGTIDAIGGAADVSCLGALQAAKESGRTDMIGPVFGIGAVVNFLEQIRDGGASVDVETTPYLAMIALEYGIRYLNGQSVPASVMLPVRVYRAGDLTDEHIKRMRNSGIAFPYIEWGGFAELNVDVKKYYPKSWIENVSLLKLPAFKTQPPVKVKKLGASG